MTDAQSQDLIENAAGTWRLDPNNTSIEIKTKAMWGMVKVNGTFNAVNGEGTVDDQGSISGELVVDAASIDTKNKKRDTHLRSEDFFNVEKYPTFTFVASTAIPGTDGSLKINGTLQIKDQALPIELVTKATKPSTDLVALVGEVTIDRSKWGMSWAKMGAGLVNQVVVNAQFRRS